MILVSFKLDLERKVKLKKKMMATINDNNNKDLIDIDNKCIDKYSNF